MRMLRDSPTSTTARLAATLVFVLAVAACGSSDEGANGDTTTAGAADTTADAGSPDTAAAAAGDDNAAEQTVTGPALEPALVITPDQPGQVGSVAVAPDGTRVALASQEGLGMPATIGLYDASTAVQLQRVEVDVGRLGLLHWMADDRIVAESDGAEALWLSWDGTTLAELPSLPLDFTCGAGRADKNTGAVYSSDGLTSMGDTLCRFDTNDGSIVRTADGVLVSPERYWLRPGTGEVIVLHSPEPDVESELVTLDAATLTPTSRSAVPFTENVQQVGDAVWLTDQGTNASRIEPGAIPLPRLSPSGVSAAATIFLTTNDAGDIVLLSSTDGSVLGVMSGGLNLAFSDWSLDDSVFARLAAEDRVEVYRQ